MPSTLDSIKAWAANSALGQNYLQRKFSTALETGELPEGSGESLKDPRMREAILKAFHTFSSTPENQKKIAEALPRILQKKFSKMFPSGDVNA